MEKFCAEPRTYTHTIRISIFLWRMFLFIWGKCKFFDFFLFFFFVRFGSFVCTTVLLWYSNEIRRMLVESRSFTIFRKNEWRETNTRKNVGIVSSSFMLIFMCFRCADVASFFFARSLVLSIHFLHVQPKCVHHVYFCLELKSLTFHRVALKTYSVATICAECTSVHTPITIDAIVANGASHDKAAPKASKS